MSADLLKVIKDHPGISTRVWIDAFAIAAKVPKQKVCGHLSWLKRSGQITIKTTVPYKCSYAY